MIFLKLLTSLICIPTLASPSLKPHVTDSTARLQTQLDQTGYLKLPPGITYVTGLNMPAEGMIEGSGGELERLPSEAETGSVGISCRQPGFRIRNVTIRGFRTGILVDANHPADGTGEAMISGCKIYDYAGGYGINWNNLSDGYILNCVVANTVAGAGDWHEAESPDSAVLWPYGATTTTTGIMGFRLGAGAGGLTLKDCHAWGNEWIDIGDFAPDSFLSDNRLEGGRGAMLLLAAYRIRVRGGTIWNIMAHSSGCAIMLGIENQEPLSSDPYLSTANADASNCDIQDVTVNAYGYLPYLVKVAKIHYKNRIQVNVPPDWKPLSWVWPSQASLGDTTLTMTTIGSAEKAVWPNSAGPGG